MASRMEVSEIIATRSERLRQRYGYGVARSVRDYKNKIGTSRLEVLLAYYDLNTAISIAYFLGKLIPFLQL
jgi:hypothetical protein